MYMDEIYIPRHPNNTQIDEKFNEFRAKLLNVYRTPVSSPEELMLAMNYVGSPEEFAELDSSVSLDHMSNRQDLLISDFHPAELPHRKRSPSASLPREATSLKTVEKLMAQVGVYTENHNNRYSKYNKHRHIRIAVDNSNSDILPLEEVLVVVRMYDPFRYKANSVNRQNPKLRQRFTVLGSQKLTELRDRIYCQCTFGPFYDISDSPKQPPIPDDKKPYDHGFFYINGTFYNDTRQPTCDYTEPIRTWAERQENIGEFQTDSMENVTFGQLKVRLGSACVFQHHGNCEHIFTFSDIRLIAPGDARNRKDYPCLDLISIPKTTLCMTCGDGVAAKIVCGSKIHLHDPVYLCDECFEAFHYVDGKKVGKFTAYPYVDHAEMDN